MYLFVILFRQDILENYFVLDNLFCWQEKETVEEEEEDDTFDMNIKVTDPEKIGVFAFSSYLQ